MAKPASPLTRPAGLATGAIILMLCSSAPAGAADAGSAPDEGWQLTLDEMLRYDDNLLRLPAGATPGGSGKRSSWIRTDRLGLKWDKSYSLQRFRAKLHVTDHHYSGHEFLNFTGLGGAVAWNWAVTPHLTGVLSTERSQALDSFSDYRSRSVRNLRTDNSHVAAFDWDVGAGWHLIGAALGYSSTGEDNTQPMENRFSAVGGQAGLKYVFPSSSYLSIASRRDKGSYPGQALSAATLGETQYEQDAGQLQGMWAYSQNTALSGALTTLRRRHLNFATLDYSGTAGHIDLRWKPTSKTSLTTRISRDISTFQSAYSSHIVTDAIGISPGWQITAKTGLRAQLSFRTRDYLGEPFGPAPRRRDRIRSVLVAADWQAARNISLSFALQRESRNSSYPDFPFSDNTATANLRLAF